MALTDVQMKLATAFSEWADKYKERPDDFGGVIDKDGNIVDEYAERCAVYFEEILTEHGGITIPPKV